MASSGPSAPAAGGASTPKMTASSSPSARFGAYIRLQEAAAAFGEKVEVPILEIVVIGSMSDGKSSLLEALLGFRFNVRQDKMRTRRPLILQMVHDPDALEPRCQFQEEDSEQYGSPMEGVADIADLIKQRTEAHLRKIQAAVSSKPIVMKAAYAHYPNLTFIDTPGFVLKAIMDEPEKTPEEIMLMVKSLASPSNRLILFLQQSSFTRATSLWHDMLKEIDPTFRRTIMVISKFDNRLKEFSERSEVDTFLSASGYLGDSIHIHPFFVAFPMDRETISNEEFQKWISKCDIDLLRRLRRGVKGGFNEEKYGPYIGFGRLKEYLQSELEKRYEEAAQATLALLEQRCIEVSMDLARLDSKLQATKDVSQLRGSAVYLADNMRIHLHTLFDGAHDFVPAIWGKTTDQEWDSQTVGWPGWPGITTFVQPHNSTVKMYGRAAFDRVMDELHCAVYSMKRPQVSREQVAIIQLGDHAGRGGGSGFSKAVAEIARATARSLFAPLIDTACDRLEFVLRSLFDLAMERNRNKPSRYHIEDMGVNAKFLASIRRSYYRFVKELSEKCKKDVRCLLDHVTSPYYDLSDSGLALKEAQENVPPKDQQPMTTPTKGNESTEGLKESQLTVMLAQSSPCLATGSETHSLDQAAGIHGGKKKDNGMPNDGRPRKRHASMEAHICSMHDLYFDKIQKDLFEKSVPAALQDGFLTRWNDDLSPELGFELLKANDAKFMDMVVAPGTVDAIQNEHQSVLKRQEALMSCLSEFKDIFPVL